MYGKYLSILAIVLGIGGTVVAILSILKMKIEDVIYTRKVLGIDTSELATLRQIYDARVGIGLVIISGLLQVFCELYQGITCEIFWMVSGIVVLLSLVYWIIMYGVYKNGEAELLDRMSEEVKRELINRKIKYSIKRKDVNKYKNLINGINSKNASFNFEMVDKCIDERMVDKSENEKIKEIKSLICYFEGVKNKSNVYVIFTICFALLTTVFSNLTAEYFDLVIILFMLGIVIVLAIIAFGVLHRDYKEAFVLKVLNFKLDELNNQSADNLKISDINNYKEYTVRVRKK